MVYRQPYKDMINEFDKYFKAAAILVVEKQMPNITLIQRKFRIGYNRAGRIMNQLEQTRVIGKGGAALRDVLVKDTVSLEKHLSEFEIGEQTMSDPAWDNRDWA